MNMAEPRKGTNRRKIQRTADKIVDRKTGKHGWFYAPERAE